MLCGGCTNRMLRMLNALIGGKGGLLLFTSEHYDFLIIPWRSQANPQLLVQNFYSLNKECQKVENYLTNVDNEWHKDKSKQNHGYCINAIRWVVKVCQQDQQIEIQGHCELIEEQETVILIRPSKEDESLPDERENKVDLNLLGREVLGNNQDQCNKSPSEHLQLVPVFGDRGFESEALYQGPVGLLKLLGVHILCPKNSLSQ